MSGHHQVSTLMIVLILVINCFGCTMSKIECSPGEAKLVNGTSDNNGVLKICLSNSTWSTVCYSYLGCNDFLVACRQAGFDNVLSWNHNKTVYSIDKPRIGFYTCDGSEHILDNCTMRTQYTIEGNCYHHSVVTLTCTSIPDDAGCYVENDVRLYGGRNSSEGQLQVCRSKQWADVCASHGNLLNYGHIACRQLGFDIEDDHLITVTANGHFYKANSTLYPTKFHYEYQRLECYSRGGSSLESCGSWWGSRNGSCGSTCYGSEVAVTCMAPAKTNCTEKDIRLVGGHDKLEGWLEVCVDGVWGRVNGKIEGRTKDVICSTLGYNDTGNHVLDRMSAKSLLKTTHNPRLVSYINCCDRDKTFSTCDIHYVKRTSDGEASSDVAIQCVEGCTHGRMRLSGGDTEHEGNVEVCVSGTWRDVNINTNNMQTSFESQPCCKLNDELTEQLINTTMANTRAVNQLKDTLLDLKNKSYTTSGIVNNILLFTEELLATIHNTSTPSDVTVAASPALPSSCKDIKQRKPSSPSGIYLITDVETNNTQYVYCHMETLCNSDEGWTRLAYVDMTDPSNNCPGGLRLYEANGKRACGRPVSSGGSCHGIKFPSNGVKYFKVCGRAVGYKYHWTDAIDHTTGGVAHHNNINSYYVDGVSLTRGSPRQHIWTFMSGGSDSRTLKYDCPCIKGSSQYKHIPSFIGNDYYCESGTSSLASSIPLYTGNPLWDGKQCGGLEASCCTNANLPWFYKQLPSNTTDYIEMRVCADQDTSDEDVPIEQLEVYVA